MMTIFNLGTLNSLHRIMAGSSQRLKRPIEIFGG